MKPVIEVKGLKKYFGEVKAVDGVDFYVTKGSLFAFLGPNGAGKSTTITMVTTLLDPDEGSIFVNENQVGVEDAKIRQEIGIVFQDHFLDQLLTVEENLMTRAAFYHQDIELRKHQVQKAMEIVQVQELANRRYGKLSGGQRRRVDIARALVHQPKILFLDEPTTGLDPQTRKAVWETIQRLQKELEMTVFLTTHYLEEASNADYVVVIDHGKVVAKGSPLELKETYAVDTLHLYSDQLDACLQACYDLNLAAVIQGDHIVVTLDHPMDAIDPITKLRSRITNFQVLHGTMDDAFIRITGKELRE